MPQLTVTQTVVAVACLAAAVALVLTGHLDLNNDVDWTAIGTAAGAWFARGKVEE